MGPGRECCRLMGGGEGVMDDFAFSRLEVVNSSKEVSLVVSFALSEKNCSRLVQFCLEEVDSLCGSMREVEIEECRVLLP